LDLDVPGMVCNCSMCGRTGAVLRFVQPDQFKLERGADHLTDYQFNKQVIHHAFCKTCGIRSYAWGKSKTGDMIAVNVRCVDDADPFKAVAAAKQVDGKSL